jgi:hypothetical protein
MIITPEFISWVIWALSIIVGIILIVQFYRKIRVNFFIYFIFNLIFAFIYAIFEIIAVFLESSLLASIGVIMMTFSFISLSLFFDYLAGDIRNYKIINFIMIWSGGFVSLDVLLEPPILKNGIFIYSIFENIGLAIIGLVFIILFIDFNVICYRIIKKEHLSNKHLILVISFLSGASGCTFGIFGRVINVVPVYFVYLSLTITIITIAIIFTIQPSSAFIAPVSPMALMIVNSSGITIYSKKLSLRFNEQLFSGAVSAINSLFRETLEETSNIEVIHIRNIVVYTIFKKHFFLVFIDQQYSEIIQTQFKEFAKVISDKYSEQIANFEGDLDQFNEIDEDLRENFFFLPQFLE